MTLPATGRPAPDPSRQLATAIAGWHRVLLTAQSEGHPAAGNPYALLQAVLHDPDFTWLRKLSDLILRIDEANAKGARPSAEAMQGFLADATALATGTDAEFRQHQQRFAARPDVAAAQVALTATLDSQRSSPPAASPQDTASRPPASQG